MSPEQQERAFEPFYRADNKRDVVGSGLGLSIVKEIAELHGGSVQLESAPGAGTTVTLLVPAAQS
jgi:signal transduction histidine kinase